MRTLEEEKDRRINWKRPGAWRKGAGRERRAERRTARNLRDHWDETANRNDVVVVVVVKSVGLKSSTGSSRGGLLLRDMIVRTSTRV